MKTARANSRAAGVGLAAETCPGPAALLSCLSLSRHWIKLHSRDVLWGTAVCSTRLQALGREMNHPCPAMQMSQKGREEDVKHRGLCTVGLCSYASLGAARAHVSVWKGLEWEEGNNYRTGGTTKNTR